jgi:hypothetical protein
MSYRVFKNNKSTAMKKFFLLLILISIKFSIFSQTSENDIIKYKAESIYMIFQNDSGQVVNEIPIGKSVIIYYDVFFKSYEINYLNKDYERSAIKLTYISTSEDGYVKMKDTYGSIFYVADNIEKFGVLIILNDKKHNGLISLLEIGGIIKF